MKSAVSGFLVCGFGLITAVPPVALAQEAGSDRSEAVSYACLDERRLDIVYDGDRVVLELDDGEVVLSFDRQEQQARYYAGEVADGAAELRVLGDEAYLRMENAEDFQECRRL